MIPDKIYLSTGTVSSNIPEEHYALPGWREKPYSQVRSVEYIRKDALLEWANERLNENDGRYSTFYDYALNLLIDKLNSL